MKQLTGNGMSDMFAGEPYEPLKGVRIFLGGNFSKFPRKRIADTLRSFGAELVQHPSKNINFCLMGSGVLQEDTNTINNLRFDGFALSLFGEAEISELMSGRVGRFAEIPIPAKRLDFTPEHFHRRRLSFTEGRNIIASRELFCGKGFAGTFPLFDQMKGNLGAFGDRIQIYSDTNIIVLSDSTVSKLEQGVKDETILYIERYYNSSDAIKFTYDFLSEHDILEFCRKRCEECGDELTMDLYKRYMDSCKKKSE